jgi:small subunit ribosomal protein S4
MIRKKRSFAKPKKAFESSRISEENQLVKKYGLKNKREIWKTLAKVNYFRKRSMALANSPKELGVLISKLKNLGFKVESSVDILELKVEDLLERRLPTIVAKKGLADTVKQARQKVVHKKILVDGKIQDSPSYIVPTGLEDKISVKIKEKPKPKVSEEPPKTETPNEESINENNGTQDNQEKEETK